MTEPTQPPAGVPVAPVLTAVNAGRATGAELAALVAAGDAAEVMVPLGPDRATPLGFASTDEPPKQGLLRRRSRPRGHLAAFTGTDKARWALPDGPPLAVVAFREVLDMAARVDHDVRFDFRSPDEVTIDPDTARTLLAGRPIEVADLGTGARYVPPPGLTTEPAAPDVAPSAQRSTAVEYGIAWAGGDRLDEPLTEDQARARHERGEPYAFRVPSTAQLAHPVVVEVAPDQVILRAVDQTGEPHLTYVYTPVHGRLFLGERRLVDHDDRPMSVVAMQQPDGIKRVIIEEDGVEQRHDLVDTDLDRSWVAFPAFGAYDDVLDIDR